MIEPILINASNSSACNLVSEVVRKSGRVRLRVSGTSMVPAMRPGDLITLESASLREIAPGEIVVFARSGRLVAHRVKAIISAPVPTANSKSGEPRLRNRLLTRGDRARRDDPMVSNSELLGRVTQIERGNRRVCLRTSLTAADRVISRLLRISDRATFLYLRVSALSESSLVGGEECRAH
jgi:signal peptidase